MKRVYVDTGNFLMLIGCKRVEMHEGCVIEHGERPTTARVCVCVPTVVRVFDECTWSVVQTSLLLVGRVS